MLVRVGGFSLSDSEAGHPGVVSLSADVEEGRYPQASASAWTPEARLLSPAGWSSQGIRQLHIVIKKKSKHTRSLK